MAPGIPWEVMDGDCIRLAGEEVVLAFSTTASVGETWDFPASRSKDILIVKADRREVLLDGKLLDLSGKPYNLLCVLYGRRGRVVSYSDIKKAVWPECALSDKGEPLLLTKI